MVFSTSVAAMPRYARLEELMQSVPYFQARMKGDASIKVDPCPVSGGVRGMVNVDKNSCYALSVIQALAHIPQLVKLLLLNATKHECAGSTCPICLLVGGLSGCAAPIHMH